MFDRLASTEVIFVIAVGRVLSLLWQQSFHWLIMGKGEIDLYCYLTVDILIKVVQKCFLFFSVVAMATELKAEMQT